MTACEHRLWDLPDGLRCTAESAHLTGHVYRSSSGSEVDDKHGAASHG